MKNAITIPLEVITWWNILTTRNKRELVEKYFPNLNKGYGFNRGYLYLQNEDYILIFEKETDYLN